MTDDITDPTSQMLEQACESFDPPVSIQRKPQETTPSNQAENFTDEELDAVFNNEASEKIIWEHERQRFYPISPTRACILYSISRSKPDDKKKTVLEGSLTTITVYDFAADVVGRREQIYVSYGLNYNNNSFLWVDYDRLSEQEQKLYHAVKRELKRHYAQNPYSFVAT